MLMLAQAALAGLAPPALAAGPEVWSALYNGRLIESADRDHQAAIGIYETVLEHLPAEDPMRPELHLWLGRAHLEAGERTAAWNHLTKASLSSDPAVRGPARRRLGTLQLDDVIITSLPNKTTFSSGATPLVRGWTRGLLSDLEVRPDGGPDGALLAWTVDVQDGLDDFLRASLSPGAGELTRLSVRLAASAFPAQMRILLEDAQGEWWTAPVLTVPSGAWSSVSLALTDFAPADAPALLRRPDSAQLRSIELRDVTGYHSTRRGKNIILVDDLDLQ